MRVRLFVTRVESRDSGGFLATLHLLFDVFRCRIRLQWPTAQRMTPDRHPVPAERALIALAALMCFAWLEAHYHGESWASRCASIGVDDPALLFLVGTISRILWRRMLLFAIGDDLLVPRIGKMQLVEPKGGAMGRTTCRWVLPGGELEAYQSSIGLGEELLHPCCPFWPRRGRDGAEELKRGQRCGSAP